MQVDRSFRNLLTGLGGHRPPPHSGVFRKPGLTRLKPMLSRCQDWDLYKISIAPKV